MIHRIHIYGTLGLDLKAPRADIVNAACEYLLTNVYKGMLEDAVFPGYTEAHFMVLSPYIIVQVNDSLLESVHLAQ